MGEESRRSGAARQGVGPVVSLTDSWDCAPRGRGMRDRGGTVKMRDMYGPAYIGSTLHFDGIPVVDLAAGAGTPLYIYSRRSIESRYRSLDEAFRTLPHRILYSVKANSSLGIL